ncbi:response regulator [bacterium]|nr:MAG: response regulator [bacterium]RIK64593.1 MAG: two-component system response regulator [Planctomycetota bacterium]
MNDSHTILLVEDNPDDEELTLRALRKGGVSQPVQVARDGPEALDYLFGLHAFAGRDPTQVPRVMLLDLKLPKLGGLDVLKRARADVRTRLMPVVILTSSVEESDLKQCYALGANSYVRKPVEFDEFVAVIRSIAHYWLSLNELPGSPYRPCG